MKCEKCKRKIPPERLEILPDTKTCLKCSNAKKILGITVWDDSTPNFVPVSEEEAEQYWSDEKSDGRGGGRF